MKNASLLLLATLVACSETVPPAPAVVAPVVVEAPAPVAKFKVGDAVVLEGMPANLSATIIEILGMQPWVNSETQEEVQFMTYLVSITDGERTQIAPAPELYVTAK